MEETKYNQIHSIFNNYLGLNFKRDNYNVSSSMGDFILFLKKNQKELNLSELDIHNYHKCYNFSNNSTIRKIIADNSIALAENQEDEIIRLYNIYDKIFDYFLTLKPYDDVLDELRIKLLNKKSNSKNKDISTLAKMQLIKIKREYSDKLKIKQNEEIERTNNLMNRYRNKYKNTYTNKTWI